MHISVAGWISVAFVHACIHKRRIYINSSPVNCRSTLCLHSCIFFFCIRSCKRTDCFFFFLYFLSQSLDFSPPSFVSFCSTTLDLFFFVCSCVSLQICFQAAGSGPHISAKSRTPSGPGHHTVRSSWDVPTGKRQR